MYVLSAVLYAWAYIPACERNQSGCRVTYALGLEPNYQRHKDIECLFSCNGAESRWLSAWNVLANDTTYYSDPVASYVVNFSFEIWT